MGCAASRDRGDLVQEKDGSLVIVGSTFPLYWGLSLPESQSLLPADNFARVVEVCKPLGEPMISANVAFLGSPVQDAPKQGEMVRNALIQELGKDFEISVEPKWVRIFPIGRGGYYWEWMVTIRRQ